MIYFRSDYSQGAHPKVMDALVKTNFEHTDGYGLDEHCEHAARMVQDLIDNHDCHVHMMVGGTPCNVTTIAASLKPYESVVSVRGGHAYFHETGAVEGTGHRIVTMEGANGKLKPESPFGEPLAYGNIHRFLNFAISHSPPKLERFTAKLK